MIVTVGACLFLLGALIGLVGIVMGGGLAPQGPVLELITSALYGAVGVGLLMRRNWARWLALGVSLLSWTLGSVLVLIILVYMVGMLFEAGGGVAAVVVLIPVAILAVVIVIDYKLFWYLVSDQGKEEFETPETETHAVLQSTVAYIAFVAVMVMLTPSRFSFSTFVRESRRPEQMQTDARERAQSRRVAETAARESDYQRRMQHPQATERVAAKGETAAEELRREMRALFEKRQRDPNYSDAQLEADVESLRSSYLEKSGAQQESRERAVQGRTTEAASEERTTGKILKCRDSSGSMTYTQAYCPPGTQPVETSPSE